MRRALALAIVGAFALAGAARAQDSLAYSGDRETAVQLSRIVDDVKAKGLPVEPVIAKVRLGALYRTPPARIVAAAQAAAARLQVAREALGASSAPADIAAGESALSVNGVTRDMLRLIRSAEPTRSVAVPIGVMAQLVATGVKPEQAAEIVTRLVRARANNGQLVALGNAVNQDVAAGAAVMSSLETRLETLRPLLARMPSSNAADALTLSPAPASPPTNPKGRP